VVEVERYADTFETISCHPPDSADFLVSVSPSCAPPLAGDICIRGDFIDIPRKHLLFEDTGQKLRNEEIER
jgi:hypothetical protein